MSAPTPANGDSSPTPGYYPDPSIPGYVRFWNGAAWVPGTSRPAPPDDGSAPAGAGAAAAAAATAAPTPVASVEETGPVFFDEEPEGAHLHGNSPEPASAWQADTSRQTGFGGDRDRRVSWGSPAPAAETAAGSGSGSDAGSAPRGAGTGDPRSTGAAAPQSPQLPAGADPSGGALPGMRTPGSTPPPAEGTVTIRAVGGRAAQSARTAQADGTMAIRTMTPGAPRSQVPGRTQPPAQDQGQDPAQPAQSQATALGQGRTASQGQAPAPAPAPVQAPAPAPEPAPASAAQPPVAAGPGGGAASWAQQVHQLAQPDQQEAAAQPVVPWKPPVSDPFLQAAQAQAAARPGGLGRRLAARLIDTAVLGGAVGAAAVPLVTAALAHIDDKVEAAKLSGETVTVWLLDGTTAGYFGAVLGAYLVLGVVYEALPTAKWGRTLGKKLCGLQVRDIEAHEPPAFGAALRRWLLYGVLGVLGIGVVNAVWCVFDRPWRQCWHDKAARTFVAGD
ncbi:RDD family protein [Streptomyces hypolithicus]